MKRLILAACAGLLAAAVASPSFAADLPRPAYKAPIYTAPAFSWSGFYVGLNAGYGWGRSSWTSGWRDHRRLRRQRLAGRRHARLQPADWRLGVRYRRRYRLQHHQGIDVGGTLRRHGLRNAQYLSRHRPWPRWLRIRSLPAVHHRRRRLWRRKDVCAARRRVGDGLPVRLDTRRRRRIRLHGRWSAKLEYLYADLGTANCSFATCGGAASGIDVKFRTNIIRAGVNYRF